jgi:coenzyme F420 hydrogenase subunit beta
MQAKSLFEDIVNPGYCIGCGACAAFAPKSIRMHMDRYGKLQPISISSDYSTETLLRVCPFSGTGPNEDEIAETLFSENTVHDSRIGFFTATYAGYVAEGEYRKSGSSGGIGTWLAVELLKLDLIDGVIHVGMNENNQDISGLFTYKISLNQDEVIKGAKSRYYPVEISQVINLIKVNPGRYLFIGIPCFIKAIRLLALQDRDLKNSIAFTLAIFCGHLKSARFAESLAWQLGIAPDELTSIDFRRKIEERRASDYGITVEGLKGESKVTRIAPMRNLIGHDWGMGFFKYQACDYCDDVVGETADISVGDAWLPEYVNDSNGMNVVVIRTRKLNEVIDKARQSGRLVLDSINADTVVRSQSAGFRHRREGLAYRLWLKDKAGEWRPPKRVNPRADHLSAQQKKIFRLRMHISSLSHGTFLIAREKNDFNIFKNRMRWVTARYKWAQRPFLISMAAGIRKVINKLLYLT